MPFPYDARQTGPLLLRHVRLVVCHSTPNPSRAKQKGARDRLAAAFLNDFADDYDAHGKTVIETVRGQDPVAYMRLAAALLPTKVEITETPLDGLTDEQLSLFGGGKA